MVQCSAASSYLSLPNSPNILSWANDRVSENPHSKREWEITSNREYSTAQSMCCCPETARIPISLRESQSFDWQQWLLKRPPSGKVILVHCPTGAHQGTIPSASNVPSYQCCALVSSVGRLVRWRRRNHLLVWAKWGLSLVIRLTLKCSSFWMHCFQTVAWFPEAQIESGSSLWACELLSFIVKWWAPACRQFPLNAHPIDFSFILTFGSEYVDRRPLAGRCRKCRVGLHV